MRTRLGDVCEVVSGSTPKSRVDRYWDGDLKWITPAELTGDSYIITDSVRHITQEGAKSANLRPLPKGTVILSSRAPIGKTAIAGCEMYCNQGFKNLICGSQIDNRYLYFFLSGNTEYLNSLGRGATFKELSKRIVEDITIPLPSLEEQRTTADRFEQLVKLINLRKSLLSAFGQLIKSRFVEMFGDPIENNMKWQVTTLLESLEQGRTVSYGIVQLGDDYNGDNGVPVFRPIDITGGKRPLREDLRVVDPQISERYKRTLLSGRELLITVRGSVGETFQIDEEFAGCNVGRNIVPLVTNDGLIRQKFLEHLFHQDAVVRWLATITKGAALKGLNMGEFKTMQVIVPPLDAQNEFVSFASQVDKSAFAVRQSIGQLELLKAKLMQDYFG